MFLLLLVVVGCCCFVFNIIALYSILLLCVQCYCFFVQCYHFVFNVIASCLSLSLNSEAAHRSKTPVCGLYCFTAPAKRSGKNRIMPKPATAAAMMIKQPNVAIVICPAFFNFCVASPCVSSGGVCLSSVIHVKVIYCHE